MDKKKKKQLITEIMHEDEEGGLYRMDKDTIRLFAQIHLDRLKRDSETLWKEIQDLKEDIQRLEQMKRDIEEPDLTFKQRSKWTKVEKKK